jgi:hypothetical protein
MLATLTGVSRDFEYPLVGATKGRSASGKSLPIDEVVLLFPNKAVRIVDSVSPHALVFKDTVRVTDSNVFVGKAFKHVWLYFRELKGIPDTFAAQILKGIISNREFTHETSHPRKDGSWFTREYRQEGPMAVYITATEQYIDYELSTRMLEQGVPNDPTQWKAIAQAVARRRLADARGIRLINRDPWIEATTLIHEAIVDGEIAGIEVEWAEFLFKMCTLVHERGNRDLNQLITAIQAHTLMCFRQLPHKNGILKARILRDYGAIRSLMLPTMGKASKMAVSQHDIETVQAIAQLQKQYSSEPVTVSGLAKRVGVSRPTMHRWLDSLEARKHVKMPTNQRGGITLDKPLPSTQAILPTAEEVYEAWTNRDRSVMLWHP